MAKGEMRDGFSLNSIADPNAEIRCSSCIEAKSHRQSFPKSGATRAENALDLIHTDLAGPFAVEAVGSFLYYIIFVDDAKRYIWVHLLR